MIRFGSAESSSASIPFGAVASEQENILSIAKAVSAPRLIERFKVTPMNRATGFSPVAHQRVTRERVSHAHHNRPCWGNQQRRRDGAQSIYVRRNSRIAIVVSVEFSESKPRRVSARNCGQ